MTTEHNYEMLPEHMPGAAQPRSTCPVCKGEQSITGRPLAPNGKVPRYADPITIYCDECDGEGTVPAGDLVQWREEMGALLRYPNAYSSLSVLGDVLRRHLAAMPQPDVNAGLLRALKRIATSGTLLDTDMVAWMREQARAAIAQAERGPAGDVR
jgi:hypothetical protein